MEKGGLTAALAGVGRTRADWTGFGDELRLGLRGQTRRVLAPRGVKGGQRLQLQYQWRYLLLVVEPLTGYLRWAWLERLRQEHLRAALERWDLDGLVWDGSGSHRGKQLQALPIRRILLPPYAPELNPAERVFEEVRRQVEGRVYPSLAAKQAAAEAWLQALAAEPGWVQRLCGWAWLRDALAALPCGAPGR